MAKKKTENSSDWLDLDDVHAEQTFRTTYKIPMSQLTEIEEYIRGYGEIIKTEIKKEGR